MNERDLKKAQAKRLLGKKRKPTATAAKVQRKRARPRQVYLSKEEEAIFAKMLKRQGVNASQLVRDWLWRAEAQYQRRHGGPEPVRVDPRQLQLAPKLDRVDGAVS